MKKNDDKSLDPDLTLNPPRPSFASQAPSPSLTLTSARSFLAAAVAAAALLPSASGSRPARQGASPNPAGPNTNPNPLLPPNTAAGLRTDPAYNRPSRLLSRSTLDITIAQRFLSAATNGNQKLVEEIVKKELLPKQVDVNDLRDNEGDTALHLAARAGHGNVVQSLIDLGVSVKAKNGQDVTALHLAAEAGEPEVIKILINAGAELEAKTQHVDGITPLMAAAKAGYEQAVEILLGAGANLKATNNKGGNALHYAAINGNKKTIEALLKRKANVKLKDSLGNTALHYAALNNHPKAIETLFVAGANLEANNKNDGATALIEAALNGKSAAIRALLAIGANIRATTHSGSTALHLAAQGGHSKAVKILLKAGAVLEAKSNKGITPLMIAARAGHEQAVRTLLGAGANLEAKSDDGLTPLVIAASAGHEQAVETLLEAGADIQATNNQGGNALFFAAALGHSKVIEILIEKGVNLFSIDKAGNNALHVAAEHGRSEIFELLVKKGANPHAKNGNDQTAADIMKQRKQKQSSENPQQKQSSENLPSPYVDLFKFAPYLANGMATVAATVATAAMGNYWLTRRNEEKKRLELKRRHDTESELLNHLKQLILPLEDLSLTSFENHYFATKQRDKGEVILTWKEDSENEQLTFKPQFSHNSFKDEIKAIFTQFQREQDSKFFKLDTGGSLICVDLDPNSKDYPIKQNGENFEIKPEFIEVLDLIKSRLSQPIEDEQQRVKDEFTLAEQRRKNEEEIGNSKKKIAKERDYLKTLNESLTKAKKEPDKVRLQGLIVLQEELIETLSTEKASIIAGKEEENQKLLDIEIQNQAAAASRVKLRASERQKGQQGLAAEAFHLANNLAATAPANYHDLPPAPVPRNSPLALQAQEIDQVKTPINIDFWKEMLLGVQKLRPITVVVEQQQTTESHPNFLIDQRRELRDKFQNYVQQYKQSGATENERSLRDAKDSFHDWLDNAVNKIAANTGGAPDTSLIRDRIYFLLNYCAGDDEACKGSFVLTENEGRARGERTGLGHASGNSQENLSALTQILKEFDSRFAISMAKQDSENIETQLKSTTSQDLFDFQKNYWIKIPAKSDTRTMKIHQTREKDNFEMMKFLVENLENPDFAAFKASVSEALENFVFSNSLAIPQSQESQLAIDRSKVLNFLQQEKQSDYTTLRKIVSFAEEFGKQSDAIQPEEFAVAQSLGAISFKDFKQNLAHIFEAKFVEESRQRYSQSSKSSARQ